MVACIVILQFFNSSTKEAFEWWLMWLLVEHWTSWNTKATHTDSFLVSRNVHDLRMLTYRSLQLELCRSFAVKILFPVPPWKIFVSPHALWSFLCLQMCSRPFMVDRCELLLVFQSIGPGKQQHRPLGLPQELFWQGLLWDAPMVAQLGASALCMLQGSLPWMSQLKVFLLKLMEIHARPRGKAMGRLRFQRKSLKIQVA